jgi:hypothetical protein
MYHLAGSPVNPDRIYASQSTGWFGQIIQRSDDGGIASIVAKCWCAGRLHGDASKAGAADRGARDGHGYEGDRRNCPQAQAQNPTQTPTQIPTQIPTQP